LLIVEELGNTGKPLNGMPGAFEPPERYLFFSLCKAGQPHEGIRRFTRSCFGGYG